MKNTVLAMVAALGAIGATGAPAQSAGVFPARQIRVIVPLVPGGNLDLSTRAVVQQMGDSLGQRILMMFDQVSTSTPHVKAGKLRALGVSTRARSPFLPEHEKMGKLMRAAGIKPE